MPRYAAKVDGPHTAIVQALRRVGCQVLDLSRVGHGCPDLLVRCGQFVHVSGPGARGHTWMKAVLMEVKTPRGRVQAEQIAFQARWPETVIVRSVEEALRAIGVST